MVIMHQHWITWNGLWRGTWPLFCFVKGGSKDNEDAIWGSRSHLHFSLLIFFLLHHCKYPPYRSLVPKKLWNHWWRNVITKALSCLSFPTFIFCLRTLVSWVSNGDSIRQGRGTSSQSEHWHLRSRSPYWKIKSKPWDLAQFPSHSV